jgi:hypothetical protein
MSGDVTVRELDWKSQVYKVLGTDRSKAEDAYVFSNGKRIKVTDAKPGGPYSGTTNS